MKFNLKAILERSPEEITKQRATRLIKVGSRTSDNYIEKLETEHDKIVEDIEDLLDFSATTDVNAGSTKITNANMEKIVNDYHALAEQLHLLNQRLIVAKEINKQLKSA